MLRGVKGLEDSRALLHNWLDLWPDYLTLCLSLFSDASSRILDIGASFLESCVESFMSPKLKFCCPFLWSHGNERNTNYERKWVR